MNVSGRNGNRTVPSDTGECPSITTGCSQPCKKRVAQAVEHERAYLGEAQSIAVLLLEAARFDMSALGGRGPYPALYCLACVLPACFQNSSDSGSHWEHSPGCCCLAMRHKKRTIAPVRPGDGLPAQTVALFRAQT